MSDLPFTNALFASKLGKSIGRATHHELLRYGYAGSKFQDDGIKQDTVYLCLLVNAVKQLLTSPQGLWRATMYVIGLTLACLLFGPSATLLLIAALCASCSLLWFTFAGALHLGYIEGRTSEAAEQQLRRLYGEA